jgi:hypothetical protein
MATTAAAMHFGPRPAEAVVRALNTGAGFALGHPAASVRAPRIPLPKAARRLIMGLPFGERLPRFRWKTGSGYLRGAFTG